MQILLTTKIIMEEFSSYIFMLIALFSASFSVISRGVINSILWFSTAVMAIFGLLIEGGETIVGIVIVIACVFLSGSLLLMNSCYGGAEQRRKTCGTFSICACLGITVTILAFAIIKSSDISIQIKNKSYDSTMYVITALFSIVSLITVFGSRIFYNKKV